MTKVYLCAEAGEPQSRQWILLTWRRRRQILSLLCLRDQTNMNFKSELPKYFWCIGRGPHLELRPEPQASSPLLRSQGLCRMEHESQA